MGVDVLEDLAKECNFPWLLSNAIDMPDNDDDEEKQLGSALPSKIIEWQGVKVYTQIFPFVY